MINPLDTPLAFLAGLLTIASPCVLPVLPVLLGSGVNQRDHRRPLLIIAGFVLSFASFAMLLGVVSSAVEAAQEVLRNAALALLALSGLLRAWPAPYAWLVARLPERTASAARADDGSHGAAFLLGVSLGAVWTPCAGPVLASILVLVVKAQDPAWSALLLTLYALGAAVPMLGIIYGGQYATQRLRAVARHAQRLQQAFGVLVVLTAAAIYLQYDTLAFAWAAQHLPNLKGL
ncbi:cytochrome c biogenesis protein CcdA [Pseudoduganella sp. DS3]|uniref:Cytochrome c biogenesis protein CcdA n=1 Tax=Pseudoduganella guangdongensis TaxID=2692179 RepID=A0A6N9HCQ6_9BURK|nr:cytochrome c biogenesis CcdA family protein [Pseudoduganella guangdongensis]MYN01284.1 cytochrome c biogenesis protein CcdA [Pseudoduganella guangdongensis]